MRAPLSFLHLRAPLFRTDSLDCARVAHRRSLGVPCCNTQHSFATTANPANLQHQQQNSNNSSNTSSTSNSNKDNKQAHARSVLLPLNHHNDNNIRSWSSAIITTALTHSLWRSPGAAGSRLRAASCTRRGGDENTRTPSPIRVTAATCISFILACFACACLLCSWSPPWIFHHSDVNLGLPLVLVRQPGMARQLLNFCKSGFLFLKIPSLRDSNPEPQVDKNPTNLYTT